MFLMHTIVKVVDFLNLRKKTDVFIAQITVVLSIRRVLSFGSRWFWGRSSQRGQGGRVQILQAELPGLQTGDHERKRREAGWH